MKNHQKWSKNLEQTAPPDTELLLQKNFSGTRVHHLLFLSLEKDPCFLGHDMHRIVAVTVVEIVLLRLL